MFKHQDLQLFRLTQKTHMSIFHALYVVGRGSETQHKVRESLNYLIRRYVIFKLTPQPLRYL